ncbi:hypothetical protein LOY67_18685 [Pseudomonas sp. B21-056]|jgi:hypothetical protein|uniref:hypothetical protein n=1 Tax=Pseudomonas sp. B21-056 TaxID=2895495 RepID=UPI00222EF5BA|nr:hypothetical protein [Pseudomonas sp. B21-056]UZE22070.1 hypothetical protein LOY67_18685 [Pseudomonas sp. B21-056]
MRLLSGVPLVLAGLCASCTTLVDTTNWDVVKPFLGIELGKEFQLAGSATYKPHFMGDKNGVGSYYIDFKHNELPFSTLKIGVTPKSKLVFSINAIAEYHDRKSCRDELISRRDYLENKLSIKFLYEGDETFYSHSIAVKNIELT